MAVDSRSMSEEELAAALEAERSRLGDSPPRSAEHLIHELSVHQIELEMQNRELRRSQLALEESRSKYADLYDLAPIGYCTLDRDGRVLEANLRAAELLGTTRDALIGRLLTSTVAIDHRSAFRDHVLGCLNRQSCAPCVLTFDMRGRGPICVELVSTPLFDATGAAVACKTTLHDITAAKMVERRLALLAEASELLSSSLEVSTTFGAVVGLTVPLLADRAVVDVVAGTEVRSFAAGSDERRTPSAPSSAQAAVLQSGEPICGERRMYLPLRARGATLGVLTLELDDKSHSFSLADIKAAQSLASRMAMAVDNAQLYRDAQAAARAREDVLAMVSHDLKNPLQAIRLNADFLARLSEPQERRSVESIQRSVAGMQGMIEDLLDLARIEAGRMVLTHRDFELGGVIAEVVELMRPAAEAKRIALRESLPRERVTVHGDRGRIGQVLSNLVGNAVKYTDAGGAVTVETTLAGGTARLVVRDSGVGIPRDQLPHIFDRYWQGHGKARLGSGLGLYIAKGIVEAHGGFIAVDSALGAGTTVSFSVPNAFRALSHRSVPPDASILIVDDDAETRDVMATIAGSHGYHADTVTNGRDALDYLRGARQRPGLVLVDLQLPGMTGWELCAALRQNPQLASIPVVLLSAAPDLAEEAAALGAAGYLKKPADADALVATIEASYRVDRAPVAPSSD